MQSPSRSVFATVPAVGVSVAAARSVRRGRRVAGLRRAAGADDLPADVCAYGSESGDSIWILAQPYDAGFPDRITGWLEPLGWTAYAHAFLAYPESVSFNLGLDKEFLSHYGVEPGDELAIFAAWR